MSQLTVPKAVLQVLLEVARQRNPDLSTVRPEDSLAHDLGLDSLDFAQVVAELEMQLGLDPFSREAASGITTVADLVSVYQRASGRGDC